MSPKALEGWPVEESLGACIVIICGSVRIMGAHMVGEVVYGAQWSCDQEVCEEAS